MNDKLVNACDMSVCSFTLRALIFLLTINKNGYSEWMERIRKDEKYEKGTFYIT